MAGAGLERRGDLHRLEREVARRLVALEHRELADEVAELLGARRLVTQDGDLVLDHRVIDDGHACALLWREPDLVELCH